MKVLLFYIFILAVFSQSLFASKAIYNKEINITLLKNGELSIVDTIDTDADYSFDEEGNRYKALKYCIPAYRNIYLMKKDLGIYNLSVKLNGLDAEYEKYEIGSEMCMDIYPTKDIINHYQISYNIAKPIYPNKYFNDKDDIDLVILKYASIGKVEIIVNLSFPDKLSKNNVQLKLTGWDDAYSQALRNTKWQDDTHAKMSLKSSKSLYGYPLNLNLSFKTGLLYANGKEHTELFARDWLRDYWGVLFLLGLMLFILPMYLKKEVDSSSHQPSVTDEIFPKDLSILQSYTILNKRVDEKSLANAMIELSSLGYIEIRQDRKYYLYRPYSNHRLVSEMDDYTLYKTDKKRESLTNDQLFILDELLFDKSDSIALLNDIKDGDGKKLKIAKLHEMLYGWAEDLGFSSGNIASAKNRFLYKMLWIVPIFLGIINFGASKTTAMNLLLFTLFYFVMLLYYLSYKKVGKLTDKGEKLRDKLLMVGDIVRSEDVESLKKLIKTDDSFLDKALPYFSIYNKINYLRYIYESLNIQEPKEIANLGIKNIGLFSDAVKSGIYDWSFIDFITYHLKADVR